MKRILILLSMLILTACAAPTPETASLFDTVTQPSANIQHDLNLSTQTPIAQPTFIVTEVPASAEKIGELYFFLLPHQNGGQIELARVSGECILDSAKCPPLEKIEIPFALNFTLNALSWSPVGNFAAFAYPDNPNGTPQKLFIFDPVAKTWTAIAEFPYIDPPFWSPDGNWVAFRAQDGRGAEDMYVIQRDGAGLKNVSENLPAEGKPYRMDGWYEGEILARPAISAGKVLLVRVRDGAVRSLFDSLPSKSQFVAAPDASLFAYDDVDANMGSHVLKVIQPENKNAVTLASFIGGSIYPIVWSPDGSLLAFNYNNLVNGVPSAEVYIVHRDGSGIASVYKGTTVGRLLFAPNGKYLLVEETTSISGGKLYLVNLATREQKILQAAGLSTDYDWYAPSWQP